MTAVHSTVGAGPMVAEAHLDRHGRGHATVSTGDLTVTWIGMTVDQTRELHQCLLELAVDLAALAEEPATP